MLEKTGLVETPFGPVAVSWSGGKLLKLDLEPELSRVRSDRPPAAIRDQLTAYFADATSGFDLPLNLRGTDFQQRVWGALRRIPAGTAVTYGQLARRLGTGPRAVGGACRANPCPIIVPCHRVVAKNGLGGFAGDTRGRRLQIKQWLLRHEGVPVQRVGRRANPVSDNWSSRFLSQ
jgi:methylated-DNA-[protein]-cysteine S-methyltransferase